MTKTQTSFDISPERWIAAGQAAEPIDIGSALVQVKVTGPQSRGSFALIEYEVPPRTLLAPLHRHKWEDEYGFVLEGEMGVLLGDEAIRAGAGELVFKPRRLWHTVWNPGATTCRILEIISPGGFEQFFPELAAAIRQPRDDAAGQPGEIGARYGVDSDPDSVPGLCAQYDLGSPLLEARQWAL